MGRPSFVEVDCAALAANAATLRAAAGEARLCAVVKANGYGHGAAEAANAALNAGAEWLAVALVEEGVALRDAGISAPVLILSEAPSDLVRVAYDSNLTPTVYSERSIVEAAEAAGTQPWSVHLKVDTGMHRAGADPRDVLNLARRITAEPGLVLGGTWTHLARADEPDSSLTDAQLAVFEEVLLSLTSSGIDPGLRHAANSAGTLAFPSAHFDMVRAGIALYGIDPLVDARQLTSPAANVVLVPALSVRSEVTMVRPIEQGEGVNYGHRWTADRPSIVALVPIGYADGVRRDAGLRGGAVLIGGVRRPIRGVVTMDQLVVDVTDGPSVQRGDEVVVIGRQGEEEISANEVAAQLGTIGYEVVCALSARLPRNYR